MDTLGDDFRDVRVAVFGLTGTRTLADFRRPGTVEALDGGADAETISAKMANTLSASNSLFQAYAPVQIGKVRDADKAHRKGRTKQRNQNGSCAKAGTPGHLFRLFGNLVWLND